MQTETVAQDSPRSKDPDMSKIDQVLAAIKYLVTQNREVTYDLVGNHLGISKESVRTAVKTLVARGQVTKTKRHNTPGVMPLVMDILNLPGYKKAHGGKVMAQPPEEIQARPNIHPQLVPKRATAALVPVNQSTPDPALQPAVEQVKIKEVTLSDLIESTVAWKEKSQVWKIKSSKSTFIRSCHRVAQILKTKPVRLIKTSDLQKVYDHHLQMGNSQTTARVAVGVLRELLAEAMRQKLIQSIPVWSPPVALPPVGPVKKLQPKSFFSRLFYWLKYETWA